LDDGVPGDFVETGVWRGGVCILLRAVLAAYGDLDRTVWVADSFQGIPGPDGERYPADEGIDFSGIPALAVSADQVRANFERYGLLDDQVRFLEGWFEETLATAPIDQVALLRLDGDLYQSTMDAMRALYPKVTVGGYVIVDDYLAWDGCRAAIDDYRTTHGIDDEMVEIDWAGVYWRRSR
ncbi:MAG: TylF/MycF family methyltransferase, partial [Acidimicrobiia bacterium]|nr:TylF/MycF family methyltransferase [Acidimicrobiia bacterium]